MNAVLDFRVRTLSVQLSGFRYLFSSEAQLQSAIADLLSSSGEDVTREKVLDRKNRADVMLGDGILIEVKTDGSLSSALRQCERYSALPDVHGIVLASSVSWARRPLVTRPRMSGKPFAMAFLLRQAL